MDIEHSIALVTAVIAVLGFVLGLPAAVWMARKQYQEAAKLAADGANSYSEAAEAAVNSQALLQKQINELREQLDRRDAAVDELEKNVAKRDATVDELTKQIAKRDAKILDLEGEIQCLHQGQADKERQIHDLEKLTELQAQEIEGLRKEIRALNKRTGTLRA